MKFTALSLTFFTLISSTALADKPHAIPNGALAIESLPFTVSAPDRNSATETRQTPPSDNASSKRQRPFAPASLEAPKANSIMDKHGAQKIKARAVIANPNS